MISRLTTVHETTLSAFCFRPEGLMKSFANLYAFFMDRQAH